MVVGFTVNPSLEPNRRIHVRYSGSLRDGVPDEYSHTFVLGRCGFPMGVSQIGPSSERTVLKIPEPGAVHNGGALEFGQEACLYIGDDDGSGDRLDCGPGRAEDWYDSVDGGNGQNTTEDGSIIRIDADARDGDQPQGIPSGDPPVGPSGLDEQCAWELRNPCRMSWTDGNTGDGGQDSFEDGGNCGWNVGNGPNSRWPDSSTTPDNSFPETTKDGDRLTDPVAGYLHRETGGQTTTVIRR